MKIAKDHEFQHVNLH